MVVPTGGIQMLLDLLKRWPLVRQILQGRDGTGPEAMSEQTRQLRPRTAGSRVFRSVCPYCAVGCGQLVHVRESKIMDIEGDPESPISEGCLCPKGAASHQLLTHSGRATRVRYRAPHAREWTTMDLDTAMDLIAQRVWESRRKTFVAEQNGHTLMRTTAIAHLGGATLDNEENYLIKKLFTGGLGMVCISNQARI